MTIDPKTSAILNLVLAVLGVIVGSTAELTTLFGTGGAQTIAAIIGFASTIIGAINSGLHSVSSPKAGPLVHKP